MNFISVKCPDCSSSMDVESDLSACYCKYCGHKIILQRNNDVRLREIEANERIILRSMEVNERMANRIADGKKHDRTHNDVNPTARYIMNGLVTIVKVLVIGFIVFVVIAGILVRI